MRLIFILLLTSCTTFDYDLSKCDCAPIQDEFNEFIYQSKIRGVKIRNAPLKIVLTGSIDNGKSAAKSRPIKKIIEIDTNKVNWISFNRKKLVYHELGHYYLWRTHEKGTFNYNGVHVLKSIMNKGGFINFDTIQYDLKNYYFDELFYN